MRFWGILLALTFLGACSSSGDRSADSAYGAEPSEVIDLTNAAPDDFLVVDEPVEMPVQVPIPLRSYYPLMNGYKVDKSVEIFPLDDWQPSYKQ